MPVIAWISLYSLVAVGLPHHHGVGVGGLAGGDHGGLVEDGGDGGDSGHFVCSCGYAGTSAARRAFVLFPGYAEVGPAHEASLELEVGNNSGKNMTKRRRVFGRAAEFTVFVRSLHRNHPRMGRTVSDSAGSSSDWIRPGSRGAA